MLEDVGAGDEIVAAQGREVGGIKIDLVEGLVLQRILTQILKITVGHLHAAGGTGAAEVAVAAAQIEHGAVLGEIHPAAFEPFDGVIGLQFKKCVGIFLIIQVQTDELMDDHAASAGRAFAVGAGKSMACCPQQWLEPAAQQWFAALPMAGEGHLYDGFSGRVRWFVVRFGWRELFLKPLRAVVSPVVVPFLAPRQFAFNGGLLPCHYANYNLTWCNERCVEVALGQWYLDQVEGPVLEIGHVLGHYGRNGHAVVDKFEAGAEVVNADITEWQTEERFALILSISTFEHIGFDDDVEGGSAEKILAAIAAARALLQPGGRLVLTLPLGYNPELDDLIQTSTLGEDRSTFLLRCGPREWSEVARHQALGTPFGRPYPYANALMVAEFGAAE